MSIIRESEECYIFNSKAKSLFSSSTSPGSYYNQEVICCWKTRGEGEARLWFVDQLCSCMLGFMKLNPILENSEIPLAVVHSLTHLRHLALILRLWGFMWLLHKCHIPILLVDVHKWIWVSSLARKFSASLLCPCLLSIPSTHLEENSTLNSLQSPLLSSNTNHMFHNWIYIFSLYVSLFRIPLRPKCKVLWEYVSFLIYFLLDCNSYLNIWYVWCSLQKTI